jgi:hypothetical protein
MRKSILWTFATVILSGSLWGQAQGQGAQAPAGSTGNTATGNAADAGKKTPEGKGEHHKHHHKHHHKKG